MTPDQLNQLIGILAPVTLFEMMVAIGMGVTVEDVLRVARNRRLVSKAIVASYVCVPAAAIGLLILFQTDLYVATGFLVVAVCPGAPYGPPFTAIAKGNVPNSVGLMVVLAGSSALATPLLLAVLLPALLPYLPSLPEIDVPLTVDGSKVVLTLLIAQFLPLGIGLGLRFLRPALANRLMTPAKRVSTLLNLTLLALILWAQFDMLIAIPLRGYVGMSLLMLASIGAGWIGGEKGNRSAMVMATSVRNVGVCLVIVTAAFAGTRAVAAVTAFALFQTIVMALVALAWGRVAAERKNLLQSSSDAAALPKITF